MDSWVLLVAAYALIWAFVFGYVIWLGRRQAELRREVELLRKAVEGEGGRHRRDQ
jgi:CcmD family protein